MHSEKQYGMVGCMNGKLTQNELNVLCYVICAALCLCCCLNAIEWNRLSHINGSVL